MSSSFLRYFVKACIFWLGWILKKKKNLNFFIGKDSIFFQFGVSIKCLQTSSVGTRDGRDNQKKSKVVYELLAKSMFLSIPIFFQKLSSNFLYWKKIQIFLILDITDDIFETHLCGKDNHRKILMQFCRNFRKECFLRPPLVRPGSHSNTTTTTSTTTRYIIFF